jgi:transglutaminase-like putative cysteine protease
MTWRLSILHTTHYRYDAPVVSSYNEARLEPRSDRHQTVLSSRVEVTPTARVGRHIDYWGTVVNHFDLQVPHDELTIIGRAVVETGVQPRHPGGLGWHDLAADEVGDRFAELLMPTAVVDGSPSVDATAAAIRETSATPADAAEAVAEWVHEHITYTPGATHVHTPASAVLDEGHGVCQDLAHLSLALLRRMGIPAWYVSGYLHPDPVAEVEQSVSGQSHAWVAVWDGAVWPLDPTTLVPVAERHVRVAAGREYGDVAPFRGVFAGHGGQQLTAEVEITRAA